MVFSPIALWDIQQFMEIHSCMKVEISQHNLRGYLSNFMLIGNMTAGQAKKRVQ